MNDRWLHCTHCAQTFLSNDLDKCPLCMNTGGIVDARSVPGAMPTPQNVKRHATHLGNTFIVDSPESEPARTSGTGLLGDALRTLRFVRFGAAGVFSIGLGIALMVMPGFHSVPGKPTLGDLLPGLGALVAGVGILGLTYYMWRKS
jgi:hypothetical protein